jgi:hypothetical protein
VERTAPALVARLVRAQTGCARAPWFSRARKSAGTGQGLAFKDFPHPLRVAVIPCRCGPGELKINYARQSGSYRV